MISNLFPAKSDEATAGVEGRIFISHRRESKGTAKRVPSAHTELIYKRLRKRYGKRFVYLDREDMHGKEEWKRRLGNALTTAKVMLVLAEGDWSSQRQSRLDENTTDWVALEIETAYEHSVPMYPVMVGTANTPTIPLDQTDPLSVVNARQAVTIHQDAEEAGYEKLFLCIDSHVPRHYRKRTRSTALALVIALMLIVGSWVLWPGPTLEAVEHGILVLPVVQEVDGVRSPATTAVSNAFLQQIQIAAEDSVDGRPGLLVTSSVQHADFAPVENDPDRRIADVSQYVEETNAAAVIFATMSSTQGSGEVRLSVEAVLGSARGVEELRGESLDFLFQGVLTSNPGNDAIWVRAAERLEPVFAVSGALGEMAATRPSTASKIIEMLIPTVTGQDGALLHHWLGNAQAELGDLDAAEVSYSEALAIDPGFQRSTLGLAEVDLLEATAPRCTTRSFDQLEDSRRRYGELILDPISDESSMKAAIGLGRGNVCEYFISLEFGQGSNRLLSESIRYFDDALAWFSTQPDPSRSAAESASLAAIARAETTSLLPEPTPESLVEAVSVLEQFDDFSVRPWVRALAFEQLSLLYSAIGDGESERAAIADACTRVRDAEEELGDADPGSAPLRTTQSLSERLGC